MAREITFRAEVARTNRRHGAITAVAIALYMDRKAVRRALEDCVRRGEMEASDISWRSRSFG